jgi:hypothetical protein
MEPYLLIEYIRIGLLFRGHLADAEDNELSRFDR